jgi:hypothetical protein
LARFGLAELHNGTAHRRFSKVTVEGDDAVHFGAREIERVRRISDGGGRDVAETMLHAMQKRQQLIGVGREVGNELVESGELVTNLKCVVRHVTFAARSADSKTQGAGLGGRAPRRSRLEP